MFDLIGALKLKIKADRKVYFIIFFFCAYVNCTNY